MSKLKKLLLFLSVSLFLAFPIIAACAEDEGNYGLESARVKAQYSQVDIYSIINTSIKALLGILGIVFFGYTFYAGLRWLTARGNEELVNRAKGTLQSAVTGLIIVVISYGLTSYIFSRLMSR